MGQHDLHEWRLPAHAEHYQRVEAEFDQVFGQISDVVTPFVDLYRDAGVRPEFLAGSTLRFELRPEPGNGFRYIRQDGPIYTHETHPITQLWVTLGVAPGKEVVSSFSLRQSVSTGPDVEELSDGLHPVIKSYGPNEWEKYHGQRSIDNSRIIAATLSRPGLRLMGFELRPLRRNADGTLFHLGQSAVKA